MNKPGTLLAASIGSAKNLRLCVAFALMLLSIWMLNSVAYPGFISSFPYVRDISTICGAVCTLVLGFVSMYSQRLFLHRALLPAAIAMAFVGDAIMLAPPLQTSAVAATLGACLHSCGHFVVTVYVALALVNTSAKSCLAILIGAYLLKYLLMFCLMVAPQFVGNVLLLTGPLASAFLVWPYTKPILQRVGQGEAPVDLAITNPFSFLPLTHRIFIVTTLFSIFTGFTVVHGSSDGNPLPLILTVVFVIAVPFFYRLDKEAPIDALYGVAYALVLGGLVLTSRSPHNPDELQYLTNGLLQGGSDIFGIVIWLTIAQMGARNIVGAIPNLLARLTAVGIGGEMGVICGNAINHLGKVKPEDTALLVALMVFVFAAYNFFVGRKLSFDRLIENVFEVYPTAQPEPEQANSAPAAETDAIAAACQRLAAERGLTSRELQVCDLLARGRNVAYIQNQLDLTRNTIRSYVSSTYAKLDVHSHQELIDLVESHA